MYELYQTVAGVDSLITGAPLSTFFTIGSGTNQEFYVQNSNDNSLIGTYNLKVRAYLEFGEDLIQDKYLAIIVNVKHQCTKATLAFKTGYGGSN